MKGARAAVLAGLLTAAVPAWGLWGSRSETIKALQKQFGAGRHEAVIAALYPDGLLKLRGDDLRRGYALLAASYEVTGRLDKSLSAYQVAVQLFPRDRDLMERLAMLLHRSGLEEQAQPIYEKLVRLDPANAQGHLGLAQIDHALGFLDSSADHFEKALQGFPQRGDLWREYGEELYEARDYRTAEPAMRRALALDPGDAEAGLDLALILRAVGRIDEALAELEGPSRAGKPEALRARALWLMEAGRAADAAAAAQALLRVRPGDPLGLYVRARLELKVGRRVQAQALLREAATQGASGPFTAKVCAALAALIGGPR
ncbi:MAG: tetratricopeptide repeat protein [Elusimicrobia bacterium]|nr:tetratricopeptide repeat protein [Elusimicrobiota bacterium]